MMRMLAFPRALVHRVRSRYRFRRGTFFLADAATAAPTAPVGYVFGTLDTHDLGHDAMIVMRDRAERFVARYADGHRAFGYRTTDGVIAAYFWCTVAAAVDTTVPWELGSSLVIPCGALYIWDCYTAAAHRRRGLYTSGLRTLRSFVPQFGCTRAVIVSSATNIPSRSGIIAAGFQARGSFALVRLGYRTVLWPRDGEMQVRRDGDPHAFSFPLNRA